MHLGEQHVIARSDPRLAPSDAAAFTAKHLYNAATSLVRQACIVEHRYLGYAALFHRSKQTQAYGALPRNVAQDILRQLDTNWRAFFAACAASYADPRTCTGRPQLPT